MDVRASPAGRVEGDRCRRRWLAVHRSAANTSSASRRRVTFTWKPEWTGATCRRSPIGSSRRRAARGSCCVTMAPRFVPRPLAGLGARAHLARRPRHLCPGAALCARPAHPTPSRFRDDDVACRARDDGRAGGVLQRLARVGEGAFVRARRRSRRRLALRRVERGRRCRGSRDRGCRSGSDRRNRCAL